ncbi:hypothetical protein LZ24_00965 [Desulfobotulus alkaliphilus]|uniref:Uncharacterized protein n=1 Tax=Desulfobotulus alkaliphilus TaxID=622671 RepID=A0A562RZ19_9BACT|nr:hypothetical protein [Desulfobotulus alkaliphilus]TWI74362.1 hypothetical protein LZ24_00965 [Desulfobotulus alkaliphilus]
MAVSDEEKKAREQEPDSLLAKAKDKERELAELLAEAKEKLKTGEAYMKKMGWL